MSKNIYVFTGPNTLFLRRDLKKWKQTFAQKYDEMNVTEFSIHHPSSIQYIHDCLTPGFLGSKKMMIIHDAPGSTKTAKDGNAQIEKLHVFLKENIHKIPEDNFMCFVQSTPDKRKACTKFLLKNAQIKDYPHPNTSEKKAYIRTILPNISNQ